MKIYAEIDGDMQEVIPFVWLLDRYKDKILGQCDCKYKNHSIFKGCPIPHKRRKMNE